MPQSLKQWLRCKGHLWKLTEVEQQQPWLPGGGQHVGQNCKNSLTDAPRNWEFDLDMLLAGRITLGAKIG